MIKLMRERSKKAIPSGLRGKNRVNKNLKLLKLKREMGSIPSKEFKSNYWKPAKDQLRKESNNKCAYCEADTKIVAHGDVEHFRPKNVYWWLAYCYDNYLYSCQICNQTYKSNLFPISGTKLRAPRLRSSLTEADLNELAKKITHDPMDIDSRAGLDVFVQAAAREDADLIDPYMFDPEPMLVYEADDDLQEVMVKVVAGSPHRDARQKAIDQVYGLNREELRRIRYLDYKILFTFRRVVESQEIPADLAKSAKTMLEDLMAGDHRFAGMNRYFVKRKWKLNLDNFA